jgi:hypothetical protein
MTLRAFFAAGLLLAGPVGASAQVILTEAFDYPDNASLNAVWSANPAGPQLSYSLDTAFGNPAASYNMPNPAANNTGSRLARNLGGNFNGTDANPLEMSFDLYLTDAGLTTLWNGARHFVELRGYAGDAFNVGGLENLLAMGVFNSNGAADGAHSNVFYQGRVTFGSDWNTLNEEVGAVGRATGWHRMTISVGSTQVRFSVDGILAEVENRPNALGFDNVVLGSGLTAGGHGSWIDNLRVEVIPEPMTALLLALGGVVLLRRR